MKPLALGALVFTLVAGAPDGTDAQTHIVLEPPATPPTTRPARLPVSRPATLPAQTSPLLSPAEERERAELAWVVFRSRNIFIGSTVATALGAALVFPAEANQCADEPMSLDRCTPGGKAMVVFGYPLLLIGGISMLSSGIVFGVMKGKLRRLEQRAAARKSRAVRWDPAGSRFVF